MNKASFPVTFTTNVYGPSGSGKTRMVKLFCGCYKKSDGTLAYMSSFQESKKDLLRKLEGLHDVNYLVDDYHPTKDYEKKRQEILLEHIVRMPENNPDGANVIMTSEFTDGVFSNQDRQLQLYIDSDSHMALLTELEWNSDKLTQIYYIFLFAVMKNYPEILQEIRDWKRKYCNGAFQHRCEFYAQQLYLVEHLFYKYCFSGEPFYSIKASLETVLTRQKKGLDRVRHHENGMDLLVELKLMLENEDIISCTYSKNEFEESSGKLVYKDPSKKHSLLYITRNTLEVGMRKQTGDTSFYSGNLVDMLAKRKMLLRPERGNERTKKLKGIRCYVIKQEKLYEYIEGCKETRQYLSE
jgi:energy-coupling factor transporter ATP-binding protein EcfA2